MKKIAVLVAVLVAATMSPAHAAKKKAPPKKIPSTNLRLACPGEDTWRENYITYKVDKQTLLKFYNNSYCHNSWVRARWGGTVKGRAVASDLWVPAFGYTDLWKAELDPLPTRRVEWIDIDVVTHPCSGSVPVGRSYLYASGDNIYRAWC